MVIKLRANKGREQLLIVIKLNVNKRREVKWI